MIGGHAINMAHRSSTVGIPTGSHADLAIRDQKSGAEHLDIALGDRQVDRYDEDMFRHDEH